MNDLTNATESIITRIRERLEKAIREDVVLRDVKSLILTDRAAAPKEHPSLWIVPGSGTVQHGRSLAETWVIEIGLTAIVQMGDNPDERVRLARSIANRAATILRRDRRLGLPYVQDVQKAGFSSMAARAPGQDSGLYAAAAQVNIIYNVCEIED